jgi:hypothetical protein
MNSFDRAIAIAKQVMAKSDARQEKADANTKTTEIEPTTNDQKTEFLKAVKEILAEMSARMDANMEKRRK